MTLAIHVEELTAGEPDLVWTDTCALADIPPASGVAALVGDRQIALVRPDLSVRLS
jgi:hypothetical protein